MMSSAGLRLVFRSNEVQTVPDHCVGTARKRDHMSGAFLEIQNLYKTFHSEDQTIEVLRGINLSIEKGDIFGIVGFSGAGK